MEIDLVGTEKKRCSMWDSVYKSKKSSRIKGKKKKTYGEYLPRYILQCTSAVIPLKQSNITDITWDMSPDYIFFAVVVQLLIYVWFFATPWTVACQGPLCPRNFPGKNKSGLPFPSPEDHSDPGTESMSPMSPALQADSLSLNHRGSPYLQ